MGRVLRIHLQDDVAIALEPLVAGSTIELEELEVAVREDIPIGHKVALHSIANGAPVVKYGVPIGRASRPIAAGEYVHVHNLESDRLRGDV
jgi:altronate dehydratase